MNDEPSKEEIAAMEKDLPQPPELGNGPRDITIANVGLIGVLIVFAVWLWKCVLKPFKGGDQ